VEAVTPTGFLMSRLATSLAEMETRMLSLRIRRGMEQRRKDLKPCRGRAPWGYQISADKCRIEPNSVTFGPAKEFLIHLESLGWRMSESIETWDKPIDLGSGRAVKAWLLNPILRGGIGYGQLKNHQFEQVVWDLHEPLITHEKFKTIKLFMNQNRRQWGSNANLKPKLLTGLCICPNCKNRLTYAGTRNRAALLCRTSKCPSRFKSTREDLIVKAVNNELQKRAEILGQFMEEDPPAARPLREQIEKLELMDDPDLEEVLAVKRATLKSMLSGPSAETSARICALSSADAWERATEEELRLVYLEFVKQIVADRGQVLQIELKI